MNKAFLVHLPHSSFYIPEDYKSSFSITEKELLTQQRLMTDAYTDELFEDASLCNTIIQNPVSRLLCDVERFRDDKDEPASVLGWGLMYTHGAMFKRIRKYDENLRNRILKDFYDPHHARLTEAVDKAIAECGYAIILDGHSFHPLWPPLVIKPDFCIGTDPFHTPAGLAEALVKCCKENGYTARINMPYCGAITPAKHYCKDLRVLSVMVEVNRKLYLNEKNGQKTADFDKTHIMCQKLMKVVSEWKFQ